MAKAGDNLYDQVEKLIRSRPGIDSREYSDVSSYRRDCRRAARYIKPALELLASARNTVDVSIAMAHLAAYQGRLEYKNGKVCVCTGMYYPTEYRRHVYDWLRAMLRANGHAYLVA